MKIDLHVHTKPLSPDSLMSPAEAIHTAQEIGLDGICFTEHDRSWNLEDIELLREQYHFPVFRGVEVMLKNGFEILVFGLNIDFTFLITLSELRKMVKDVNGFMVYAHPFRGTMQSNLDDTDSALDNILNNFDPHDIDAIEGHNGRNTDKINNTALKLAERVGLSTTGGSDAHANWELGTCTTIFQDTINTEEELVDALKSGRYISTHFRKKREWSSLE